MAAVLLGLRTNALTATATGGSICEGDASSSEALGQDDVPFFGEFGAAWDDAMVARWSASPLGMLWTSCSFLISMTYKHQPA